MRDVLADLARDLNGVDETEEAERPEGDADEEDKDGERLADDSCIEIDHDTHGVGGSPPIAETILRKIREAAVFVADVTPICMTSKGKRVPNPNVMIELGYAMKVLEHERIVLVMNSAEGASLKHLPFDLRHWRAPVAYNLRKEATDEQRNDVAAELRAAFRQRIVPGLKLAKAVQTVDRRRANRAPELVVTVENEGGKPWTISQTVRSLDVKSLDDIRAETPLLPLPAPQDSRFTSISRAAAMGCQASLGTMKPVALWSREETEGYNQWVAHYYSAYKRFLDEQADYVKLVMRSRQLKLSLENNGTLLATGIDVDVFFPAGIMLLYDDEEKFAAEKPNVPEPPPLQPMAPGAAIIRHAVFDNILCQHSFPSHLPRSTHLHPTERRVRFSLDTLKHNCTSAFDTLIIAFATANDISSFNAEYVITANEPIDPIRGSIFFQVQRDDA
ncbi:MAG: hypothetical protein H7840_16580 [Alphaproteobacteria bacterium]